MSRAVYVLLKCDHPECAGTKSVARQIQGGWYMSASHIFEKKGSGFKPYGDNHVLCEKHHAEADVFVKRYYAWDSRRHSHGERHGRPSAVVWATKHPPPEMPTWLLAITGTRFLPPAEEPTPEAVRKFAALEVAGE